MTLSQTFRQTSNAVRSAQPKVCVPKPVYLVTSSKGGCARTGSGPLFPRISRRSRDAAFQRRVGLDRHRLSGRLRTFFKSASTETLHNTLFTQDRSFRNDYQPASRRLNCASTPRCNENDGGGDGSGGATGGGPSTRMAMSSIVQASLKHWAAGCGAQTARLHQGVPRSRAESACPPTCHSPDHSTLGSIRPGARGDLGVPGCLQVRDVPWRCPSPIRRFPAG